MKELLDKWKEYQVWCERNQITTRYEKGATIYTVNGGATFEGFMAWLEKNTGV
jgi:hypothetical protein